MRSSVRWLLAAAALMQLTGCLATSTNHPYPVVDNSPNPAPVAGYRVQCRSEPGVFNLVFDEFVTACRQIIPPAGDAILRVRG